MELTQAQQDHFNKLFGEAVAHGHPPAGHEAVAGMDPKKLFCDNWPMLSMVLGALPDLIKNPIAKATITMAIPAINALHGTICK